MQTVAVFALKGGVGKSALTVFLADFFSSLYDQRVLVIDLDPQQSATIALLGEETLGTALKRDASVGRLLLDCIDGKQRATSVLSYLTVRPKAGEKKRYKYLQPVSVLASDWEVWLELNAKLCGPLPEGQNLRLELLRNALQAIGDEFDIALVDFPASYTGPITQMGLAASDWWLLPVEPNRMAARDLDGPRRLLRQVCQQTNRRIKGLGTVLSRCQNRASSEYRRTKAVLTDLAHRKRIPKLFSKDSEITFSVEALNALDDTLKDSHKTIDQRYGGSAKSLHEGIRKLTREILDRLKIPAKEVSDVDTMNDVNAEITKTYQSV